MTHTTVIKTHAETYPWDSNPQDLVRWVCETCHSAGHFHKDEAKARRGARAHRQRHNGGPKALQNLLTLEW